MELQQPMMDIIRTWIRVAVLLVLMSRKRRFILQRWKWRRRVERVKVEQSVVGVELIGLAKEDLEPMRRTSVLSLDEKPIHLEINLTDSLKH